MLFLRIFLLEGLSTTGAGATGYTYGPVVSNDGTTAFTSTATDLDPSYANPNGNYDAYVRRRDGAIKLASASAAGVGHTGVFDVQIASQASAMTTNSTPTRRMPSSEGS